MPVLALIAWSVTAIAGLYLLAIWLIEYDPKFRHAAATRLPIPIVVGHGLFAVGGLASWVMYLITDKRLYSWTAVGALVLIAALGMTMAVRWIGVYRARPTRAIAQAVSVAAGSPGRPARPGDMIVPPERHLPVSGVIAHAAFAIVTIVLVVLTVFNVRGS
jgi:hypothetical protein